MSERKTICAACGLPGHRFGRNEGMERFDRQACINLLLSKVDEVESEAERLRADWVDLYQRLERARELLRTPDSSPRLIAKSQGIGVALDYVRGYGHATAASGPPIGEPTHG